jgi:hypothetical protein
MALAKYLYVVRMDIEPEKEAEAVRTSSTNASTSPHRN